MDLQHVKNHLGKMNDVVIHSLLFGVIMTVLFLVALAAGSFVWFLAAFFGWGSVLFAQSVYVFVLSRATMSQEEEDASIQEAAKDTGAMAV